MQLLMRRPEITGFISIAPPANMFDFSFLAPCPSSGLMLHGDSDDVVPPDSVKKLVDKLSTQKGITIDHVLVKNADHYFGKHLDEVNKIVTDYLNKSLPETEQLVEAK
jgi:alpha/beta superfamily hydrolase